MDDIIEGVWFIPGRDEFIPDSHSYILGRPSSHDFSLVDPGLIGKGEDKIQSIQAMGIRLEDVKRIIMTHTHLDHIGCLPELKNHLPWAELWIHELEAAPLEQGDERIIYGLDMFRHMCQQQYGLKPGGFAFQVDKRLRGDENVNLGGTPWEVLHIPGHSPGSIALYNAHEKVLIPGDVVYADYAIGRFDLHKADGAKLKKSLRKLAQLEVEILLPGHNRIVKNLSPGYILETARQWEPYLV
ncbi:MAG: MBL fold metallo-hydrolase [Pseudomonadota bacterium]